MEVLHHAFLTLKRSTPGAAKSAVPALLVLIDAASKLSIYSMENESLLDKFDLGHGAGRSVVQLELSPTQENHFVVTVDDQGGIRVHNIKIIAKKGDKADNQTADTPKPSKDVRTLNVTANLASSFTLAPGALAEARKLNVVLPIERGSQTVFVAGDSLGGISVFYRNGTMKGRVRVTEDPGGVKGLIRAQGQQQLLFHSSHAFGFFFFLGSGLFLTLGISTLNFPHAMNGFSLLFETSTNETSCPLSWRVAPNVRAKLSPWRLETQSMCWCLPGGPSGT